MREEKASGVFKLQENLRLSNEIYQMASIFVNDECPGNLSVLHNEWRTINALRMPTIQYSSGEKLYIEEKQRHDEWWRNKHIEGNKRESTRSMKEKPSASSLSLFSLRTTVFDGGRHFYAKIHTSRSRVILRKGRQKRKKQKTKSGKFWKFAVWVIVMDEETGQKAIGTLSIYRNGSERFRVFIAPDSVFGRDFFSGTSAFCFRWLIFIVECTPDLASRRV